MRGNQQVLPSVIKQLKEQAIDGFNVTVPYKQVIVDYLDELDPDAEILGAVNTVVNQNGKWKGYSTDGEGYVRSIVDRYPALLNRETSVLLLGAGGGAARGIYRALGQQQVKRIDIANRSKEKAEDLLPLRFGNVQTSVLSYPEAELKLAEYDLVVQTTSVGMKPNVDKQIISLTNLRTQTVVSDIVYQPIMTKLLADASKCGGASIHHGHAMLLYQGQLAFEKWTGKNLDVTHLVDKLENKLRGV
ncbi:shikimate 5-dehydrogenase I alpha [Gracilibacillus boraciitolerans JCM 21714]|uniref:shikimate dehydrogenase (NADP(+)) n=1 Tax=Gracilibacillus boraciitolerans JCM 21714 TaxID=1298598 RepID=W4VLQ2_9BACI|nr:shikimate dehydrogenase [Gracilibacillus boraciitolerans]GAE94081.1 shikimate 5-dehydrogenase I alpha [Gracilibacillus boraciitolerans JCM 21714]